MAAKKTKAASKSSSPKTEPATVPAQTDATQIKRATADDVAPIEQAEVVHPKNPKDESVETPIIDPNLSSDNQHSTYQPSSEEFPEDQGPQTEEVPGKP